MIGMLSYWMGERPDKEFVEMVCVGMGSNI